MERVLIAQKQKSTHKFWRKAYSSRYLILMIIPAIIFYAIFNYVPMYGILMAFETYYPAKGILGSDWVWFSNFGYIFHDPEFFRVLGNTLLIGSCKILISFVSSILVALLINEIRLRFFKKTVQIIVTFPHFLSWVVVAGFIMLLFTQTGLINGILKATGHEYVNFLGNGNFFLGLIFTSDVWKEAGWSSIIYIATMAGISPELYEAADIDGATRLQKIWHITLPGIRPTAVLLLIMSVGGVLSAGFDQIFNLYNKLVYEYVDILDTYIYRKMFASNTNPGIATAIGLFKSVVSFTLVIITDRIAKAFGERGII